LSLIQIKPHQIEDMYVNYLVTLMSHNFKSLSLPSMTDDIQVNHTSPILWFQGA